MKAHPTLVMFAALFLAAGRLAAHDKTLHVPPHEHPLFVAVTTTFELDDGTIVTWTPAPGMPDHYTVKIRQVRPAMGATKIYSMLTLGLQSIRADNIATLVAGNNVNVYTHNVAAGVLWNPRQTQPIPRASHGASTQLDPDDIKFISFDDRDCEITVVATRGAPLGETRWDGFPGNKSGHDNTPPGGYPPN